MKLNRERQLVRESLPRGFKIKLCTTHPFGNEYPGIREICAYFNRQHIRLGMGRTFPQAWADALRNLMGKN